MDDEVVFAEHIGIRIYERSGGTGEASLQQLSRLGFELGVVHPPGGEHDEILPGPFERHGQLKAHHAVVVIGDLTAYPWAAANLEVFNLFHYGWARKLHVLGRGLAKSGFPRGVWSIENAP